MRPVRAWQTREKCPLPSPPQAVRQPHPTSPWTAHLSVKWPSPCPAAVRPSWPSPFRSGPPPDSFQKQPGKSKGKGKRKGKGGQDVDVEQEIAELHRALGNEQAATGDDMQLDAGQGQAELPAQQPSQQAPDQVAGDASRP